MKEQVRRHSWDVAEVDFHRVSLPSANPQSVVTELESLLVIFVGDLMENLRRQVFALLAECGHERFHGDPAPRLQLDSHGIGPMPKHVAEAFADFFESFWSHGRISF